MDRKPSTIEYEETETHERLYLGRFESLFVDVHVPAIGTPERIALERKFKWKVDLTILPCIVLMYILNYLDRNNIAAARLGTLQEDLGLSDTQFSTSQIILFSSYIFFNIPSNMLLERIGKPQLFLNCAMLCWGMLCACVAAVHSFAALAVLRVLIGAFEAAFYPGVVFYLSCWYTRRELAARTALFVCGSWLSGAFSGLIASGIMENLDGVHGLASWRWLFLIEGVATVGGALLCAFIMPELPATTRWFTKEERLLGIVRLIEDIGVTDEDISMTDGQTKPTAWTGLVLALKDPKTYVFISAVFFTFSGAGISAVFPTIVNSLGYSRTKTLLLTAPPWLFVAITSFINSWHSDKTGERFWHCMIGPSISIIAFIIGISTTKFAPRYVCMMLVLQMYTSTSLMISWGVNSVPRPPIKRASVIALFNVGANIPNLYVPYLFNSKHAPPHFYAGFGFCLAMLICGLMSLVMTRMLVMHQNKKLDRGIPVDGIEPSTGFRFLY